MTTLVIYALAWVIYTALFGAAALICYWSEALSKVSSIAAAIRSRELLRREPEFS